MIGAQVRVHQQVPLAHTQWFREQLIALNDDEIEAAFDAAVATDGLDTVYATGDVAKITNSRVQDLPAATRAEIGGFCTQFRTKIDEPKAEDRMGS